MNIMKKILITVVLLASAVGLAGCDLLNFNQDKMTVIDPEAAKAKALTFINANLVAPDSPVTIGDLSESNGMYKMSVVFVNGNSVESYMTKDGRLFFPESVDMDNYAQPESADQSANSNASSMNLQIETLQEGSGEAVVQSGDAITVDYTGTLEDGTKFDSSLDRGEPYTFTIGQGAVIPGWEQGLLGMKVGEKRKLTVPADLGYGATGAGDVIPPNATLLFEVELLSIN